MGKNRSIIYLVWFALIFGFRAAQAEGTNRLSTVYELTALGADEVRSGKYDKAIIDFSKSIELCPTNCYGYLNRAVAYSANQEDEKAIVDFDKFISMNPTNGFAFIGRAHSHANLGKYESAVADLDRSIKINDGNIYAYTSRGFCYEKLGQYTNAQKDFYKAVQIDPSVAGAWNSLAWLQATCPSAEIRAGKAAVMAATKACDLTDWKGWMDLDTLAVAYAEAGDFESAIKYEVNALQLVDPKNKEVDEMKKRLLMFQQKQPYREEPVH